jgi:glucokinase
MQVGDRPGTLALVGDVGGTNCRLALFTFTGEVLARWRCMTDDFPGPGEAIESFLAGQSDLLRRQPLSSGAVAIAAPTGVESVQLTNSPWRFDRPQLERQLGLRRFLLVNDLAAQARAVMDAPSSSLEVIGGPLLTALSGTVAVVGPGTGLGVARVDMDHRSLAATEGGHVGFAPNDDVELELLRFWRLHLGRVTNEHVISGPGLVRVYRALAALNDRQVHAIEGPEIMRRALGREDPACLDAVERFAKILGAVCADIVLAQGAHSLALVGGIPEAMLPILRQGGFRARFEQRGPGGAFLASTPSVFVAMADLGLRGALACLQDAVLAEGVS